jgi:hypothetical protein
MHPVQALALRRVAIAGTGLASTLVAHAFAVGGLDVVPSAPLLWAMMALGAGLCGSRGGFLPRSFTHTAVLLLAVQTALHALLVAAPWTLGLAAHHHAIPVIDPRSVAVHMLAALLLAFLLRGADRALATAIAIVRVLTGPERRRTVPRPFERVRARAVPLRSSDAHRPRSSRGPPIEALLLAGPARTR